MPRRPSSIYDHAVAAAEAGLKVFPLAPMSKKPPKGLAWREWATTDRLTIDEYWSKHPDANYGIVTGSDNDLVVLDPDTDAGLQWWRSLGFEPGKEVVTPRGGRHVIYRTDGTVEVQSNNGDQRKNLPGGDPLHPDVDVRGEGGYIVGAGSITANGTYKGDMSGPIPDAPAELIALLPERQVFSYEPPEGEQVEEASETERKALAWCVRQLEDLDRPWHDGAGWRSTVFGVSCYLWRMVNSPKYALNEATAVQLLLDHAPEDEKWGSQDALSEWIDAQKRTAGQYAEDPDDDDIPTFMPILQAQVGLPEQDSRGRDFWGLVEGELHSDTEGGRWDRRHQILQESFRAGLEIRHAMSLVNISPAARDIDRLTIYKEAKKALAQVEVEVAGGSTEVVSAPADERAEVRLLSDEEREWVRNEADWFGSSYMNWIKDSSRIVNMAYNRLYSWIVLSIVFGMVGVFPGEQKPLGMNLWGVIIGPSSSGKSVAMRRARRVLKAYFTGENNPNLGSDATAEAMHDALIARDGLPSYMFIDEAHALLGELTSKKGYRGDLVSRWNDWYEGEVSATLRSTKKEVSGKEAATSLSIILQGTSEKMANVITDELWESGFMARPLFAIGEEIRATEDELRFRRIKGKGQDIYDAFPKHYAVAWSRVKQALRHEGDFPLEMDWTQEADDRMFTASKAIRHLLKRQSNQVAMTPYANRFTDEALIKMASLVALSAGRVVIELDDVKIALEAAEHFLADAIEMSKRTMFTDFTKRVDAVERFIAGHDGRVERSEIYRAFSESAFEVDRWIDQLTRERRAKRDESATGGNYIQIIRQQQKEAA